ncbi:MAG: YraN family protein [Clostridia bacterium]|nr:YraN family protein [Clostridia bacterium]
MDNRRKTGLWGEIMAVRYLRDHGYDIINTNFRVGRAEIDIIAADGEQLVVAEVKTRAPGGLLPAAEAVDREKRALLLSAGAAVQKIYKASRPIRYDIIEVYYADRDDFTVHHIKQAF